MRVYAEDSYVYSINNRKKIELEVYALNRLGVGAEFSAELPLPITFAGEHYKDAKIIARWAAQDCMTLDGAPYIGKYSQNTPDLYVATGFNKWGISSSMVSAMVLSDLVLGKRNEYAEVFSPSRSILRPQLAVNAFESIAGLLTPTAPRCPHLGCALKYNPAEHSWDCPCHGSRFTESGELIDGPATDDKKNMPPI